MVDMKLAVSSEKEGPQGEKQEQQQQQQQPDYSNGNRLLRQLQREQEQLAQQHRRAPPARPRTDLQIRQMRWRNEQSSEAQRRRILQRRVHEEALKQGQSLDQLEHNEAVDRIYRRGRARGAITIDDCGLRLAEADEARDQREMLQKLERNLRIRLGAKMDDDCAKSAGSPSASAPVDRATNTTTSPWPIYNDALMEARAVESAQYLYQAPLPMRSQSRHDEHVERLEERKKLLQDRIEQLRKENKDTSGLESELRSTKQSLLGCSWINSELAEQQRKQRQLRPRQRDEKKREESLPDLELYRRYTQCQSRMNAYETEFHWRIHGYGMLYGNDLPPVECLESPDFRCGPADDSCVFSVRITTSPPAATRDQGNCGDDALVDDTRDEATTGPIVEPSKSDSCDDYSLKIMLQHKCQPGRHSEDTMLRCSFNLAFLDAAGGFSKELRRQGRASLRNSHTANCFGLDPFCSLEQLRERAHVTKDTISLGCRLRVVDASPRSVLYRHFPDNVDKLPATEVDRLADQLCDADVYETRPSFPFAHLLLEKELSDVLLIVDRGARQQVPAHKLVLGLGSKLFADMFRRGRGQAEEHVDIEYEVLLRLLSWLYRGRAGLMRDSWNWRQCVEVHRAAEEFVVPDLMKETRSILADKLDRDNCLDALIETRAGPEPLFQICVRATLKHIRPLLAEGKLETKLNGLLAHKLYPKLLEGMIKHYLPAQVFDADNDDDDDDNE